MVYAAGWDLDFDKRIDFEVAFGFRQLAIGFQQKILSIIVTNIITNQITKS